MRGIGYVPQVDDVLVPLKVSGNLNMCGYPLGKSERALMLSPRILILDEPAGLSAALTEAVLTDQVRTLADRGRHMRERR